MGYEVTITRCELSQEELTTEDKIHRKLKYGNLDLDTDVWKTEGNKIVPVECLVRWDDQFAPKGAPFDVIWVLTKDGTNKNLVNRAGRVVRLGKGGGRG